MCILNKLSYFLSTKNLELLLSHDFFIIYIHMCSCNSLSCGTKHGDEKIIKKLGKGKKQIKTYATNQNKLFLRDEFRHPFWPDMFILSSPR